MFSLSICSPSSHHSTRFSDEAIRQHPLVLVEDKMFSLEVRLRVQVDLMKTRFSFNLPLKIGTLKVHNP